MKTRVKKKKPAATRDEVYTFAYGCIEYGEVEAAAVAVICFEWLRIAAPFASIPCSG